MHEAVAKDAKLQIQVALGLVSQEQTPRKNISFDSGFRDCAELNFQRLLDGIEISAERLRENVTLNNRVYQPPIKFLTA